MTACDLEPEDLDSPTATCARELELDLAAAVCPGSLEVPALVVARALLPVLLAPFAATVTPAVPLCAAVGAFDADDDLAFATETCARELELDLAAAVCPGSLEVPALVAARALPIATVFAPFAELAAGVVADAVIATAATSPPSDFTAPSGTPVFAVMLPAAEVTRFALVRAALGPRFAGDSPDELVGVAVLTRPLLLVETCDGGLEGESIGRATDLLVGMAVTGDRP